MSSDVTFDKVKDNYVKIVDKEVNNVLQPRRGDKLPYDQKSADDWSKDIADNILKATEKENKNNDFKLIVSVSIFQKGNASLYDPVPMEILKKYPHPSLLLKHKQETIIRAIERRTDHKSSFIKDIVFKMYECALHCYSGAETTILK